MRGHAARLSAVCYAATPVVGGAYATGRSRCIAVRRGQPRQSVYLRGRVGAGALARVTGSVPARQNSTTALGRTLDIQDEGRSSMASTVPCMTAVRSGEFTLSTH